MPHIRTLALIALMAVLAVSVSVVGMSTVTTADGPDLTLHWGDGVAGGGGNFSIDGSDDTSDYPTIRHWGMIALDEDDNKVFAIELNRNNPNQSNMFGRRLVNARSELDRLSYGLEIHSGGLIGVATQAHGESKSFSQRHYEGVAYVRFERMSNTTPCVVIELTSFYQGSLSGRPDVSLPCSAAYGTNSDDDARLSTGGSASWRYIIDDGRMVGVVGHVSEYGGTRDAIFAVIID